MNISYAFQSLLGRQALETACTNSRGKKRENRANEYQDKIVLVGGNSLTLADPVDSTPLRGQLKWKKNPGLVIVVQKTLGLVVLIVIVKKMNQKKSFKLLKELLKKNKM